MSRTLAASMLVLVGLTGTAAAGPRSSAALTRIRRVIPTATVEGPRIMYWWGKVSQHTDGAGAWHTDPDGSSGADLPKLEYCQRWYPKTVAVREAGPATISTWREHGNVNAHTATQPTFVCVQP